MIMARGYYQHRDRLQAVLKNTALLLLAVLAVLPLVTVFAAQDTAQQQLASAHIDGCHAPSFPLGPVYRIPLRVHLGESGRDPLEFKDILDEINHIWLSQAGIFFVMQVVLDDEPLEQGMDIWFMPTLQGIPGLNGYFQSAHDIQVRDNPILKPAEHPARHPAARTAAHECGHGLSLPHRQDSDDNLMRSKTSGWQLNAQEIRDARKAAAMMALPDAECSGDAVARVVQH
ncbi:MAG: hypothetical protein HGB21_02595 [Nitrospirae bacterium]|nr:hypothetical protein [Nitrospirota bacterium]